MIVVCMHFFSATKKPSCPLSAPAKIQHVDTEALSKFQKKYEDCANQNQKSSKEVNQLISEIVNLKKQTDELMVQPVEPIEPVQQFLDLQV